MRRIREEGGILRHLAGFAIQNDEHVFREVSDLPAGFVSAVTFRAILFPWRSKTDRNPLAA